MQAPRVERRILTVFGASTCQGFMPIRDAMSSCTPRVDCRKKRRRLVLPQLAMKKSKPSWTTTLGASWSPRKHVERETSSLGNNLLVLLYLLGLFTSLRCFRSKLFRIAEPKFRKDVEYCATATGNEKPGHQPAKDIAD